MSFRQDRRVLRELAQEVAAVAALPVQAERVALWTACNDLQPVRPMVLADPQGGWDELDAAWVQLQCQDPALRSLEHQLRRRLVRHHHIPDDFPILDTVAVPIPVSGASYQDYGLPLTVAQPEATRGAYRIQPAIRDEGDLLRLHPRPVALDWDAAMRQLELAQDMVGDLLQVHLRGRTYWRYGLTRVLVHMRGLEQMLLDMYDRPQLLHRLMAFLRDDFLAEIELFEAEAAVALNNTPDNITGSGGLSPTRALPGQPLHGPPGVRHCICWGESQETGVVGPAQFDEFVLQYQLPLLRRFGLVDYGCCEPLDQKLELLMRRIPHLRWLAVQRWADRRLAAERVGRRYVYVYKPNPAPVCTPTPDWDEAARDLAETLALARGCPLHLVLKDTHTFCHQPQRLTHWCQLAGRLARQHG